MNCINDPLARRFGLWGGVAFLVLYLYSVGNIVIAPGVDLTSGSSIPSASIAPDWDDKIWKPIAPFVWEPIVALYPVRSVALFISVPNMLLALLLGTLVGFNMAVAIARASPVVTAKGGGGFLRGFFASLPALLTGFTCCVPTLILVLGSLAAAFTVAAVAITPYFLPLAAIALISNLLWSMRQLSCAPPATQDPNKTHPFIKKRKLNTKEEANHAF